MSELGPTTAVVDPVAAPGRLRRYGAELSAARAAVVVAVVAVVAGGALALAATRAVDLVVVVAVVQAAFVLAWVLDAAVVSGDTVSGDTVSGDTVSRDTVSGDTVSGDTVSGDVISPDTASQAPFDAPEGGPRGAPSGHVQVAAIPATPEPDHAADERPVVGRLDAVELEPVRNTSIEDSALAASGAMPGRMGALIIGAGTAAATDFATMHWPHSSLSPTLGILGLAVPVMFVHQLTRGVVRARVVESLSGIALIVVAVVAVSALMPLRHEIGGGHLVAAATGAGGVAVALGLLVDLVWPRPRFDRDVARGLSGVVVGAVAGAAVGAYLLRDQARFSTGQAVLCCAGIAAVSALVGVATSLVDSGSESSAAGSRPYRAHPLRPVALALLPLMLVAPGAYVLLSNA